MTLATDQNSDWSDFSPMSRQFLAIREAVMDHWEAEVRARIKGAGSLESPVLTNTLPAFFDNIAEALSPAHPRLNATSNNNAAAVHGDERARMTPFGADQVIHEYQIFREAIAVVAKGRVALGEREWTIIDQSLNVATREAIRAFTSGQEELRRRLAAALSHDMRTPLAVIANGADVIGAAADLATARRVSAKIATNAARLGDMMAELLDALTRQGGAKYPLHLSRFDIIELVAEAREQYCQGRACEISFEAAERSIFGYWCKSSLLRALENLINNALKYGNGKAVSVRVEESRGRLMLSVHNQGNPIPAELHNSIFDYLRREGDTAAATGWGIGLQFVKTVAEGHGGSTAVDSSAETGTTFLIDVPVDCRPYVSQL